MCNRHDFRYGLTICQMMALLFAGWLWGHERRADLIEENTSLTDENDRLREENRRYRRHLGQLVVENLSLQLGIVIGPNVTVDVVEWRDASDEAPVEEPDLRPWCCLPSYTMLSAAPNTRCDCHAWLRRPQFRQPNRCYGHPTFDAGALSD
jgi:hypothetical protein